MATYCLSRWVLDLRPLVSPKAQVCPGHARWLSRACSGAHDTWTLCTSGSSEFFWLMKKRLQLGCRCVSFNLCSVYGNVWFRPSSWLFVVTLSSFLRSYRCYVSALIKDRGRCCKTKALNKPRRVTSERNSPSQFCPNMLTIVWPCKKLPMEILESLPLFLKGKRAFIWKLRTPGNDRHSLWIVWK